MSSKATSMQEMTLEYLHSIIPHNFDTIVSLFTPGPKERNFICILRINIFQKEDAMKWLEQFEGKSSTIWRVARSYGETKNVFKKKYHCFHTTKRKRSSVALDQQVTCPARLTITIKQSRIRSSSDQYNKTHPCVIQLRSLHNHDTDGPSVLKYRTPSEKVQNMFRDLFARGCTPSTALHCYKTVLEEQVKASVISESKKQDLCPTLRWVYSFHDKLFKIEHSGPDDNEIATLEKNINDYNEKCGDVCAAICRKDDMLTIALCSPLMKRVHMLLDSCNEIMFIDSSKNLDRHNSRVFILLSSTFLGALPLGLFIIYSLNFDAIVKGLKLLQKIFPESPFCGMQSPQVIITEDCGILRQSMSAVFPNTGLYLSKFHVLQSVIKCLWFDKNGVELNDRPLLYNLFRHVFYSNSAEQMQERFHELLTASSKYTAIKDYFSTLEKHAGDWASYQYSMHNIYQFDSNDFYFKATFRVFTDKECKMLKAFNIVHLFRFLTSTLNEMYSKKIVDYMSGRVKLSKRDKFFCNTRIVEKFEIKKIEKFFFEVYDTRKYLTYFVDTDIICCTCPMGLQGFLCKHHHAVVREYNLISYQFSIKGSEILQREKFLEIAVGKSSELDGKRKIDHNADSPAVESESHFLPSNISDEEKIDHNADSPDVESESHFLPSNVSDEESNSELGTILCQSVIREKTTEVIVENENAFENDITNCQEKLMKVFDDIKQRLNNQPLQFCSAINKFTESYHECKTDAALINALNSFGMHEILQLVKNDNFIQERTNLSSIPFQIVSVEGNYIQF